MTKLIFFVLICFLPLNIFAFNDPYEFPYDDPFDVSGSNFMIEERRFEIGIVNIGANISNDLMLIVNIFTEVPVFNIDDLAKGFRMNLGVNFVPFYFNYNAGNWGIGLSAGVHGSGAINLHSNMLMLKDRTTNARSDVNAAVFASLGIDSFVNIKRFKVKFKPALYYTLAYVMPDILYTFNGKDDGIELYFSYDLKIFSAFDFDNPGNFFNASPGFDLSVGVEYPLSEELGLNKRFPILHFDVGLDLINIPIVPSTLRNYTHIWGGYEEPITVKFDNDNNLASLAEFKSESSNETGKERIIRPFKMIVWADWRPFYGNNLFTVTPLIGFAVNPLFHQWFSMEAGIKASVNPVNIFRATVGVCYNDRVWKNSLDLAFNLRMFEFSLGASLQSPRFASSWNASGFGAHVGLVLGW